MTATLPSGTVTFLFTDIEGSSTRWDQDPGSMRACLMVHNRILDAAIGAHGGHVVKTMGDGYMAVFARPDRAVEAAADAQRELLATEWGDGVVPVRVRMGLHTGHVEVADGDYLGPDVNRASRIEAAGHGGQILMSEVTRELAAPSLSPDLDGRDLGRHELRGLSRPERLFQLVGDGLVVDFPPLRTAEAGLVRNPPLYHTSFVGREEDITEIASVLDGGTRLLTLLGPGGAGKTRLSVEAAERLADRFAHGVVFCPLASVESEDLAVSAIATAIGFSVDTHSSDLDPRSQVLDYLSSRSILVVLDNFENLLDSAGLVVDLLAAGDGVSVLVTSRERLRLSGEMIHHVAGLGEGTDDVALFADRAFRVAPDFDPEGDAEAVRAICSSLAGSPLGIEMAAAWIDVLSPSEIEDEIRENIGFLESQDRDVDDRHRSLRAVFDSSWKRLTDRQQNVLRRLAVFRGTFDRQAAEAIAEADIRTLSELVAKSLVRRPRPGRFDLHPLIAQFVADALHTTGERDHLEERHARHYAGVLREQRDRLDGSDQGDARDLLREDVADLRHALLWLVDHGTQDEIVGVLEAVYLFFLAHSWHEGIEFLAELADRARRRADDGYDSEVVAAAIDGTLSYLVAWVGDLDRATVLAQAAADVLEPVMATGIPIAQAWAALGAVQVLRGDQAGGQPLLEKALGLLEPEEHASLHSLVATTYGWSFYEEGDFDRADEVFVSALRAAEGTGATLARAYAISKLGLTAEAAGDHAKAIDYHHEGREAFVKMGDPAGESYASSRLSWTYWRLGDHEKAREFALEALFGFERINHRWGTLATLSRLGMAEVGLGELESAEMHFRSLIDRSVRFTMPRMGELYGRIGLAEVAAARGDVDVATRVLAALDADPETPKPFRTGFVEPGLDRLRRRMAPDDFDRAMAAGAVSDDEEISRILGI